MAHWEYRTIRLVTPDLHDDEFTRQELTDRELVIWRLRGWERTGPLWNMRLGESLVTLRRIVYD